MVAGSCAAVAVLYVRGALRLRAMPALVLAPLGVTLGARLQYRLESMPLDYALGMPLADMLEPGVRIPLGIVIGGLAAALWCVLARAPWRDVGDALAVAALVMVPFGRVGCWMNGCCLGSACPSWLPVCIRFPPGSEPYGAQLASGLIDGGAAMSLPAHPLPFYFAAVALLILAVLVQMIRQGAVPGMPLAVAIVLGSAGKLALEELRSTPRPMGPTWTVPAIALLGTLAVLAIVHLRADRRTRFRVVRYGR
jgi:phosphatidylglycerol:prolipoprotein diacylglycerol transferase